MRAHIQPYSLRASSRRPCRAHTSIQLIHHTRIQLIHHTASYTPPQVDGEQQHAARDDADELAAASGAAVAAAESVASAIAERTQGAQNKRAGKRVGVGCFKERSELML